VKISLTEREYRLLFDLLYVAEWVLDSQPSEEESDTEPYRMVIQKIYSFAEEMGCGDLIDADGERSEYVPTRAYEESTPALELIDQYDDMVFWEQLNERLVDRDITEEIGEERRVRMTPEEYLELAAPLAEQYEEEFLANGIERLMVVEEE
jgi:hypothetical protein